jgi:hypothetical protein
METGATLSSAPPVAAVQTEQVFLSYSRADRDACIVLQTALEQAGCSVYRDEDSNRVGERCVAARGTTMQ